MLGMVNRTHHTPADYEADKNCPVRSRKPKKRNGFS